MNPPYIFHHLLIVACTSLAAHAANIDVIGNSAYSTNSFASANNGVDGGLGTNIRVVTGTSVTWTKNNTYFVTDKLFIPKGTTLTIEAGTKVYFSANPKGTTDRTDDSVGSITACRGGKLIADGTAADPIVFTSVREWEALNNVDSPFDADTNIGPAPTATDAGQWGGIILLGQAFTSVVSSTGVNAGTVQIEGFAPAGSSSYDGDSIPDATQYGVSTNFPLYNADNSGIIRYCSIRHGGYEFASGKEINGLTLSAVGSGTIIEYVEVYANQDDGIEFFGGTVNTNNLVMAFNQDDSFDIDQGYRGVNQFWFGIQNPGSADAGGEWDGVDGSSTGYNLGDTATNHANPVIYNGTFIGAGRTNTRSKLPDVTGQVNWEKGNFALHIEDYFAGEIYNSVFDDYAEKLIKYNDSGKSTGVKFKFMHNTIGRFGSTTTSGDNASYTIGTGPVNTIFDAFGEPLDGNSNGGVNPGYTAYTRNGSNFLTEINPVPASNSPLIENAISTGGEAPVAVSYRGAFAPGANTNWAAGWTKISQSGLLTGEGPNIPENPIPGNPNFSVSLTSLIHGNITGAGIYAPNAIVTLTAAPDPGYTFIAWSGQASGSGNPLTLTITADLTIGGIFSPDLADDDGDGLSNFDETVTYGTNSSLADSDNDGLSDTWELGNGRFSIVAGNFTWASARADARSNKHGDLASLPDSTRHNYAMESIGIHGLDDFTGLWIGASDSENEGSWTWVNGEAFSFQQWSLGRPNTVTGNSLDYAEIAGGGGASEIGNWYDRSGTTTRDGYLLEIGFSTNPTVADADGDGLKDGMEQSAGTNPFLEDSDSDGLSDRQEIELTQTNPLQADTDKDGIHDAAEDQDGDSLSNLAEITQHGTDPLKHDTDGDGLADNIELAYPGSFYTVISGAYDHAQATADAISKRGRLAVFPSANEFSRVAARARQSATGDLWLGLSDATNEGTWLWDSGTVPSYQRWMHEQPNGGTVENHALLASNTTQWADGNENFTAAGYLFERLGLDPLLADTDRDGLSDGAEATTHETNPQWDDSDGDGLTDGAEVSIHQSDPNSDDTDNDGLSDRVEVEIHQSNPSLADTDGDGFDDLFEVNTGFVPTLDTSTPDAVSGIATAVKFHFNAANNVSYRIEQSINLQTWTVLETGIIGTGGVVKRFYEIENHAKRYFRVRRE